MGKAREFWVGLDQNDFPRWLSADPRFAPIGDEGFTHKETIHVIEKAAYDEIYAKWDFANEMWKMADVSLFKTQAKLELAIKALDYLVREEGYGTDGNEHWDNAKETLAKLKGGEG